MNSPEPKKTQEWYDNFNWENSTQKERDDFYNVQKVQCRGDENNENDRCGWVKKMYRYLKCEKSSWLDLACHDGFVTRSFLKDDCTLIGVDISQNAIDVAKEEAQARYPEKNWQYINENFFNLDWDSIKVDNTCCFEFIEHIPYKEVDLLLKLINDSTKDTIFLSTPMDTGKFGHGDANGSHINIYNPKMLMEQVERITGETCYVEHDEDFIYAYVHPKGSKHGS